MKVCERRSANESLRPNNALKKKDTTRAHLLVCLLDDRLVGLQESFGECTRDIATLEGVRGEDVRVKMLLDELGRGDLERKINKNEKKMSGKECKAGIGKKT